jgi:glycosyltransferase involved in cell wall biosynthesis
MPNSRRVYFAIPGRLDTLTGGYGYDREMIAELIRMGWMVEVLPLPHDFPQPSLASLAATSHIFAALPEGATVIIDGLAFGVMDAIAEAESKRLKLIALCHHPLALETGLSAADATALRESETRALAAATAVIVTSAQTARLLITDFAVPAEKITLAQPGTQRQSFIDKSTISPRSAPVLLTLATLTRRKGHDTLIAALAEIQHLKWQARFVGGQDFDPAWTALLHRQVENAKLGGRIDFIGGVTDTAAEFRRADLFVLPSRFEGYGMAFAEALSFGMPIVGASAGAVPDLVPEYAGVLVPPNNSPALAAALTRLLTDADFYHQLQQGARRAAQTLPTWQQSALVIAHLLQKILR